MKRVYYLDGEEINWKTLIKRGIAAGMDTSAGIFTTSEAADVLREQGHTVECKETEDK